MVNALDFRKSGPGSTAGRGHCIVFLGKTLYSHVCLSLPRSINGYRRRNAKMMGVTCDGLVSRLGGLAIFLIGS